MKEILLFGGTTEGRKLSEKLAAAGIMHTVCVATKYGELVLKEHPLVTVHCGRMEKEQMRELMLEKKFAAVVDATHPYAELVSENIREAMQGMRIPYLRLKRECNTKKENVLYFQTNEECAKALENIPGNLFLTTGSKELACYCESEEVKKRLFVRVLPGLESLKCCMQHELEGKQIIAMQGPFTTELNEALIRQYHITCLVTKQSGSVGGYEEKLRAAENTETTVCVIGQPRTEGGLFFKEICRSLEAICQVKILQETALQITLVGVGMGNADSMTGEVKDCIEKADILLGAERLLAPFTPGLEKKSYYLPGQIVPYLRETAEKYAGELLRVTVLFSGDSGFYSGSQKLYSSLQEEIRTGQLQGEVRILPGISSVAYLAAYIGESYEDAAVLSVHGKRIHNLADRIRTEKKTFLLTSGVADVNRIGMMLQQAGLEQCEIVTGYQLSYPKQQITKRTPAECAALTEEGLYTCFIKNEHPENRKVTHGISDREFCRDKVPMTKEEVREVSICKLALCQKSVVYDIGSGTGSVAAEIAALSPDITVYAIEKKPEAVALIKKNKEKHSLENMSIIEAYAPECLKKLPPATHAFIGGSGGRLKEILQTLYQINPHMRLVINAVTMETICEIGKLLSKFPIEHEEIVQLQVSRTRKAGEYHLMQAENPVWICSFVFNGR